MRLRQVESLPREAFAAALAVESSPASVAPGARFRVELRVENRSPVAWPRMGFLSRGRVLSASYHWKTPDGTTAVHDGLRTPLRTALASGAATRVGLDVAAPERPGGYVLEVDLVQEGVAWFSDHGSPVARVPMTVGDQSLTPSRS